MLTSPHQVPIIMYMLQVLFVSAAIVASTASPIEKRLLVSCSTDGTDINTVVKFLRNAAVINGLDPFKIDDVPEQLITFRYLLSNHNGTLHLTQGLAQDLSTLYLANANDGDITCQGNYIVASLLLNFEDITTSWKYTLNAGLWNPEGYLTAVTVGAQVNLDIALDLQTALLSLQVLDIVNIGTTDLTFTSMGIIENAVRDPIKEVYAQNISPLIRNQISQRLTEILENTPPLFTPTTTTTETTTTTTEATTTTTEAPTTTTEAPTIPTEAPTTTTEAPTIPTEAPTTTTEAPTTTTEAPTIPTEAPTTTTEAPTIPTTTEAPTIPTEVPTTTTEAPTPTSEGPTPTTEAPTPTTEAPTIPTTTEAPTIPTEVPSTPTEAPTPTTEAPTEDPGTDFTTIDGTSDVAIVLTQHNRYYNK